MYNLLVKVIEGDDLPQCGCRQTHVLKLAGILPFATRAHVTMVGVRVWREAGSTVWIAHMYIRQFVGS